MQTLDVISVNLWQILISLANLFILFLGVKKFLFKPIKAVLDKRQSEIDERYASAEIAENEANLSRKEWEEKLSGAQMEADTILNNATENARYRGEQIVLKAEKEADGIIRTAKTEAELEKKKAALEIKKEIVEVSGALAEKMLEREIKTEDHRELIDSFIEKIGDMQ